MNGQAYEYAVLRYIHDPVTQESLNIGVLIYCKAAQYLELKVTTLFGRLSEAFVDFDGASYRTIVQRLQAKTHRVKGELFPGNLLVQPPERISEVHPKILILNDSSFEFGKIWTGIAPDLDVALESLYERLVTRYTKADDLTTRYDSDVWKVFVEELEKKRVVQELQPKVIQTPTFEVKFEYAWKNESWHPLQPLSFDLKQPESIQRKASRWIGNFVVLRDNQELGTAYLLIGKANSSSDAVQKAYVDAVANLRAHIPNAEIYEEDQAGEFAGLLAERIADHTP